MEATRTSIISLPFLLKDSSQLQLYSTLHTQAKERLFVLISLEAHGVFPLEYPSLWEVFQGDCICSRGHVKGDSDILMTCNFLTRLLFGPPTEAKAVCAGSSLTAFLLPGSKLLLPENSKSLKSHQSALGSKPILSSPSLFPSSSLVSTLFIVFSHTGAAD